MSRAAATRRTIDAAALVVLSALFAVAVRAFAFHGVLAEYDLYMTGVGLWDGAASGRGLGSPLHYGKWFSFGYVELFYALFGFSGAAGWPAVVEAMNRIGFWSTVACVPLLWVALAVAYGRTVAWLATAAFALSPVFLEVAGGEHQLLPALAAMLAGCALIWWRPESLPARVAAGAVAALLLAAALSIRFEVAMAFPFVVLVAPAPADWRGYVRSAASNLAAPVSAILLFFLLRHMLLGGTGEATSDFVSTWYSIGNIPRGVFAAVLAAGLVTTALSLPAAWAAWRSLSGSAAGIGVVPWLGPIAGIGSALLFWLPNPFPGRHFLFFALAATILVAISAARLPIMQRLAAPIVAGVLIGLANQLAADAMAPVAARLAPSRLVMPWPVTLPVMAGDSVFRRVRLQRRWGEIGRYADRFARTACGSDVVLLTEFRPMFVAPFLRAGATPRVAFGRLASGISFARVETQGRRFTFVSRDDFRGREVTPQILADPRFAAAAFAVDPFSRQTGDRVAIPAGRRLRMDCHVA